MFRFIFRATYDIARPSCVAVCVSLSYQNSSPTPTVHCGVKRKADDAPTQRSALARPSTSNASRCDKDAMPPWISDKKQQATAYHIVGRLNSGDELQRVLGEYGVSYMLTSSYDVREKLERLKKIREIDISKGRHVERYISSKSSPTKSIASRKSSDELAIERRAQKFTTLMIVVTCLEAEDILTIAALYQLKSEPEDKNVKLMIVFTSDLCTGGTVFEKKLMIAGIVLGGVEIKILEPTSEWKAEQRRNNIENDEQKWKCEKIECRRESTLREINKEINSFEGEYIDMYFMGPGYGNIHDIYAHLSTDTKGKIETTELSIALYSGVFAKRTHSENDIEAICELTKMSKRSLVDLNFQSFLSEASFRSVGKKPSLLKFLPSDFAQELQAAVPLLHAGIKILSEETAERDVSPDKIESDQFKMRLTEEDAQCWQQIRNHFIPGHTESLKCYADALLKNMALVEKFQNGALQTALEGFVVQDTIVLHTTSPVFFFYEFLSKPGVTVKIDEHEGQWARNRLLSPGVRGVRPFIAEAEVDDPPWLNDMGAHFQKCLLRHFQTLDTRHCEIRPFALPLGVKDFVFETLLADCIELSATFDESKKLGKGIAVGSAKKLKETCECWSGAWEDAKNSKPLTFDQLKDYARSDGALAVDGSSGCLIQKVAFKDNGNLPDGTFNLGGMRHRSAFALARSIQNDGLVFVVSEGGTTRTVKVFVDNVVYLYDGNKRTWCKLYEGSKR